MEEDITLLAFLKSLMMEGQKRGRREREKNLPPSSLYTCVSPRPGSFVPACIDYSQWSLDMANVLVPPSLSLGSHPFSIFSVSMIYIFLLFLSKPGESEWDLEVGPSQGDEEIEFLQRAKSRLESSCLMTFPEH